MNFQFSSVYIMLLIFRKGQDLQYKKIATFFHRMKVAIENEIRKAKFSSVI